MPIDSGIIQRVQADLKTGTPGQWSDVPVTDAVRAAVAAALNGPPPVTPTPVPIPTPVPTPPPPPPPVTPTPLPVPTGRKAAGRQEWAKPSQGGEFGGWDIVGTPEQAAADAIGIRVTAAKSGITLDNLTLRGWSNGLTVEHSPGVLAGRLKQWTIRGVTFADNTGPPLYRGQGCYLAAADDVVFDGCYFVGNGRMKDRRVGVGNTAVDVSNGFSHGCYVQGGLTQWAMPEGCRRVTFRNCTFAANAAWGALCKGDACRVIGCLLVGNAYGMLLNGPLPCVATGNVVIPGPRPAEWYAGQRGGAGGIQLRAANVEVRNNLCILPPENRMPDRNWRAPAFEATLDAGGQPNYHGPIVLSGGDNYAFGWDQDVVTRGVAIPGIKTGPCPAWGWTAFAADVESKARSGSADVASLIALARKACGLA